MARLSGVGEALVDVWLAEVGTFVRRTPAVPADMLRRRWSGGARSVRSTERLGGDLRVGRVELCRVDVDRIERAKRES